MLKVLAAAAFLWLLSRNETRRSIERELKEGKKPPIAEMADGWPQPNLTWHTEDPYGLLNEPDMVYNPSVEIHWQDDDMKDVKEYKEHATRRFWETEESHLLRQEHNRYLPIPPYDIYGVSNT